MGAPIPRVALLEGAVPGAGRRSHLRSLLVFVKPHIAVTFALVGVAGSLVAGARREDGEPVLTVLAVASAVLLLSTGAECWTNILDRDMDARMPRTARRPLVTGEVSLREAAALAAALCTGGLAIAVALGPLPLLFLGLGLANNVVIYSALTKRATPWSVVLGSMVAPLTLWAGYAAVAVPISAAAWLLGGMVGVWIYVHIWVIALRYRDDYAAARVPMAPLVWPRRWLMVALGVSGLAMGAMATGAFLEIATAPARWAALPVAAGSLAVTAAAALAPRRGTAARWLVHAITAYLIVVLGAVIACVL